MSSDTPLHFKDAVADVSISKNPESKSDLIFRFNAPLIGVCADFSCFEDVLNFILILSSEKTYSMTTLPERNHLHSKSAQCIRSAIPRPFD